MVAGSNPVIHPFLMNFIIFKVLNYLLFFQHFFKVLNNFFIELKKVLVVFLIAFLLNLIIFYKQSFIFLDFLIDILSFKLFNNKIFLTYDSFQNLECFFYLSFILSFFFFICFFICIFLIFFKPSISKIFGNKLFFILSIYPFILLFFNIKFFKLFLFEKFKFMVGFQLNSHVSENLIYLDYNLFNLIFFIINSFLIFNFFLVFPLILFNFFINFKKISNYILVFKLEIYFLLYILNIYILVSAKFILLFFIYQIIMFEFLIFINYYFNIHFK